MQKYAKPLALVLAVILCVGVLAACTGTTTQEDDEDGYDYDTDTTAAPDDTASDATDDTSDDAADATDAAEEDVIGVVTYVYDSMLTLEVYTTSDGGEVFDYATLDADTLVSSGETAYPYIYSDAEYYTVSDGTFVAATAEDVAVDQMVAVTTTEDGIQQVIILTGASEDATGSEVTVAEVTAIADDGTLTISKYELTEAAADYEITDYAAVDFENYTDSLTEEAFTPDEYATIEVVEDGTLVSTTAEEIVVGDMLVIYTDEYGYQMIAIYHSSDETAE